jgi:hypothetical protein
MLKIRLLNLFIYSDGLNLCAVVATYDTFRQTVANKTKSSVFLNTHQLREALIDSLILRSANAVSFINQMKVNVQLRKKAKKS